MVRRALSIAALAGAVFLTVGVATLAQDPVATATPAGGTPTATRCEVAGLAHGTLVPEVAGTPVASGDCGTPTAGTPVAVRGTALGATTVEIRFVDMAFVPSEVTIPADTDVTLTFVNDGVAAHNFKIAQPETFSGYLAPGGTGQVVVNLPAGSYPYFCTIPGHAQSGMSGVLTVK